MITTLYDLHSMLILGHQSLCFLLFLHNLLQFHLEVVIQFHPIPELPRVKHFLHLTPAILQLIFLILLEVLLVFVLIVFGGLELDVDIDDVVGEDEVLVGAAHPWGLWSVFNFRHFQTIQDVTGVDLGVVVPTDPSCIRHQVAHFGAHNEVGQFEVDPVRSLSQNAPKQGQF